MKRLSVGNWGMRCSIRRSSTPQSMSVEALGICRRLNAGGNTMAQIYNTVATIQLAKPLTQTASIDVITRKIGLPADWSVDVSPSQITLAPGQQITVTVTHDRRFASPSRKYSTRSGRRLRGESVIRGCGHRYYGTQIHAFRRQTARLSASVEEIGGPCEEFDQYRRATREVCSPIVVETLTMLGKISGREWVAVEEALQGSCTVCP